MEFCYGIEAANPACRDAGDDGPRGNRGYTSVAPYESGRNISIRGPIFGVKPPHLYCHTPCVHSSAPGTYSGIATNS